MSVRRVRGIELSDDPSFSRKSWKVERAGWIGDRYLEDVEITSIRPEPLEVRAEGDGTTYLFATGSGGGRVDVRFEITNQKAGVVKGRLGRSREAALAIRHFVYP